MRRLTAVVIALIITLGCVAPGAMGFDEMPSLQIKDFGSVSDSGFMPSPSPRKSLFAKKGSTDQEITVSSELPRKYSSVDAGIVTPVKDQGSTGTCWAFSSLAALESDAIKNGLITYDKADFSESHLSWFANTKISNPNDVNDGEGYLPTDGVYDVGGNWQQAVVSLSNYIGAAKEADYPFYPYGGERNGHFDESLRYDHSTGIVLDSAEAFAKENVNGIKNWIKEHGACTAAIFLYANDDVLSSTTFNTSTGAYYYPTEKGTNHMVTIVGWDDDYAVSNFSTKPSKPGAWIVKNSYGTDIGDRGYFYVSYEDKTTNEFVGFTARSSADYSEVYSYTTGFPFCYTNVKKNARFANVFKTEKTENLQAISLFMFSAKNYSEDISINVEIRVLPEGYTSPADGYQLKSFSTTTKSYAYDTIDIPDECDIPANSYFAVIITNLGAETIVVNCENKNDENDVHYTSTEKQSYFYLGRWLESTNTYGNFYIQAYAGCAHDQETVTVAPTCTTEGSFITTCKKCKKVLEEGTLPMKDHDYEIIEVYTPATCTSEGSALGHCRACGQSDTITLPKLAHSVSEVKEEVKPTCFDDGYIIYYCKNCNEERKETIASKGHEFSSWQTVSNATVDSEGSEKRVCGKCSAEETRSTPKLTTITLADNIGSIEVNYGSTVMLGYNVRNLPANAEVHWFVDGKESGTDTVLTREYLKQSFEVFARITLNGTTVAESQHANINVKSNIFLMIIAFFKNIFGVPDVVKHGN